MTEIINVDRPEDDSDSHIEVRVCEKPPDSAPIQKIGTPDGATVVTCNRCGVGCPAGDSCDKCGAWLPRNQASRQHGAYARQQPGELVEAAEGLYEGVMADLGGTGQMSTIQQALAAKLRDTDILIALNTRTILTEGVETPGGRRAHDRFLAAVDRFVRIASLLGLERRSKRVQSLQEVLHGRD